MLTMENNILQLGAVAIIFLFAIKEFFSWLRSRKNGIDKPDVSTINLKLKEISNDNHHEIIDKLDTLTRINDEQLFLLREIKGSIDKLANK